MPAFTVIDHEELGTATGYWEHTGIPTTYDHLLLLVSGRSDDAVTQRYATLQVGDGSIDTGSNYSGTTTLAKTSTPISERDTSATFIRASYINDDTDLADTFASIKIWIPHYANTANYKQMIVQTVGPNNSTADTAWSVGINAGLWRSTDNIERMRLSCSAGNWMEYSTFTLYGITGA